MDFTPKIYKQLLESFQDNGYSFQTFEEFITKPNEKVIVLRHDVDRMPKNALELAIIEQSLGIKATYFYRIVKEVDVPELIEAVRDLGHEIAYHYEDLTLAKGDKQKAIKLWKKNLTYLRTYYPVKTVCMHGSPMTKWDNRDIWQDYSYKQYGIIAEPYFDVNYEEIFYITEAGRSWNNTKVSMRDKVKSSFTHKINSINDIIILSASSQAPNKLMINVHPHNWSGNWFGWTRILMWQSLKNIFKRIIISRKSESAGFADI